MAVQHHETNKRQDKYGSQSREWLETAENKGPKRDPPYRGHGQRMTLRYRATTGTGDRGSQGHR